MPTFLAKEVGQIEHYPVDDVKGGFQAQQLHPQSREHGFLTEERSNILREHW
jgi:hypothetical protein